MPTRTYDNWKTSPPSWYNESDPEEGPPSCMECLVEISDAQWENTQIEAKNTDARRFGDGFYFDDDNGTEHPLGLCSACQICIRCLNYHGIPGDCEDCPNLNLEMT